MPLMRVQLPVELILFHSVHIGFALMFWCLRVRKLTRGAVPPNRSTAQIGEGFFDLVFCRRTQWREG